MLEKINLRKIVNVFGFISVLSILGISFLTWRFCDDFRYEKELQTKGVFEYMYYTFMTWDGRLISIGAMIQMTLIKYLNLQITVFIWTLFFVLNSLLIFKIVLNELNTKIKLKSSEIIFVIALITLSLFYGFYTHISETLYWAVGGGYTLAVSIGLIWIIIYKKINFNNLKKYNLVFYSMFSIIVGMLTQNLTASLLAFLFIDGIIALTQNDKRKVFLLSLLVVCLLIGVIIVTFSPGSLLKASAHANSFDTNPLHYFNYFYTILKVFLRASIIIIPITIFTAFAIYVNFNLKITKQITKQNNKIINFLITTKWLIICIFSIFPFLLAPTVVCYRVSLVFMVFLFIFILLFIFKFLNKFEAYKFLKFKTAINIFLLLMFTCHLGYMAYSYKLGFEYQTYMTDVDNYLKTQKNATHTIIVKNKTLPHYPFMFNIKEWGLTNNPNMWINKEWSFYYDIKNIRTE